mgnify:CR=1 FL=1
MRTWANTPEMRDAFRDWYEKTPIKDQSLAHCWQAAWNAAKTKPKSRKQQDLFGVSSLAFARNTDPDTSQDAAKSFDPTFLESKVLSVIQQYGSLGCIKDDVMKHFRLEDVPTISPRFAPLMRKGWIEDTGERRRGLSGRPQRVMRAIR